MYICISIYLDIYIDVLREDAHVVVVNKQANLV